MTSFKALDHIRPTDTNQHVTKKMKRYIREDQTYQT